MTIEELGGVAIDVSFWVKYNPGEAPTYYYPDGSGNPGCADSVEYLELETMVFYGPDYTVRRNKREDWFELLDRIVEKYVLENLDKFETEWMEEIEWLD